MCKLVSIFCKCKRRVVLVAFFLCFRLTDLIIERQYPDRPARCASWSGLFTFYVCHVVHFSPDASESKFSSCDNKFYRQNLAD